MRVYFSTVVRGAPLERAGELVLVDWDRKAVVRAVPVFPEDPDVSDYPRDGGSRGGRGIQVLGDEVVVGVYHTLKVYDRELHHRRDVTNGLLAGVHELHTDPSGRLWVASTGLDGVVAADPATGAVRDQRWPRQDEALRRRFDLKPPVLDTTKDNRRPFADEEHVRNRTNIHLNAVSTLDGDVYALFNGRGCVVNLDRGTVVVEDPNLVRAHNLIFDGEGTLTVNDTIRRVVRTYDVETGRQVRAVDLNRFGVVRRLQFRYGSFPRARRVINRWRGSTTVRSPGWLRGLDRYDGMLFVGISPSSILRIDEASGELIDHLRYSTDLHQAVHGLHVERPA